MRSSASAAEPQRGGAPDPYSTNSDRSPVEFTFNLGPPPQANRAAPLLYASVPGRASALGNDEAVFLDPASGRTHVMTQQVLAAMDRCRQFKPMDAHVDAIVASQPGLAGQQVAVRRVLEGLATRGLLLTDQQLMTRFSAVAPETALPFAGAFIRACNRPAQLQRLLESLTQYETRFAAGRRYVVLDDSSDATARASQRRMLGDFARASGADAVLLDRDGWESLVDAAAAAVPASAGAARALMSRRNAVPGGGAGMNLAMLLSAGSRLALLDDDFAFPLHRHPNFHPGLLFDQRGWAAHTFPEVAAALAAGTPSDADPFDLHLALCGQRLGAITRGVPDCRLDGGPLHGLDLSRNRLLDPQRRVIATLNGHRGQSGADSLNWLFLLPPAARASMSRDRATFLATLDDPAVWYGTAGFTVSARGNYTPFCVDNRSLMPCTLATGRGEDAMFAALSQVMYPDDVVIDTPFAIAHVQESVRDRKGSLARAERPGSMKCFADFALDVGPDLRAADPALRLAGLAARLRDLAGADDAGIQSYLAEYLAYRRSRMIEALQRSLASAGDVPEGWALEVKRLIEANARALADGGIARLGGWPDDVGAPDVAMRFRADAVALADAVEGWPALWAWGREHGESWLERHRVSA
jgi:hypothetical protein